MLKLKPDERPDSAEEFDRVLASAYSVLSAVGPIRLVDDGAVSRDEVQEARAKSFLALAIQLPRRKNLGPLIW